MSVNDSRQMQRSCRRGFSMAEVVISIAIVGIMLVAALNTTGAAKSTQQQTSERGRAMLLAEDLMSEILAQDYDDAEDGAGSFGLESGEAGAGSRALWEDVDDYNGWSASPPEKKDGTPLSDFSAWGRSVVVQWVTSGNLTQAVDSDTGIKCIVVTVTRNGREIVSLSALRTNATPMSAGGM